MCEVREVQVWLLLKFSQYHGWFPFFPQLLTELRWQKLSCKPLSLDLFANEALFIQGVWGNFQSCFFPKINCSFTWAGAFVELLCYVGSHPDKAALHQDGAHLLLHPVNRKSPGKSTVLMV